MKLKVVSILAIIFCISSAMANTSEKYKKLKFKVYLNGSELRDSEIKIKGTIEYSSISNRCDSLYHGYPTRTKRNLKVNADNTASIKTNIRGGMPLFCDFFEEQTVVQVEYIQNGIKQVSPYIDLHLASRAWIAGSIIKAECTQTDTFCYADLNSINSEDTNDEKVTLYQLYIRN